MKKINLIFFVVTLFFAACKKTSSTEESQKSKDLPSVLNYLTALSTPVDMQFNIESSTSMLISGNNTTRQTLKGTALNVDGNTVNVGSLFLNSISVNPVNNYYERTFDVPSNFYGQQVIFKTNTVSSPLTTGFQFTDTLYAPNEIVINPTSINQDLASNKVFTGKNIQWQADLNNTNGGVIIIVEYFPQDVLNTGLSQQNSSYLRNGIVVPDNGSVNLDASLFVGMPKNAYLLVTFVRANYRKGVTNGLKSYLVAAYSQKYMNFKFQ